MDQHRCGGRGSSGGMRGLCPTAMDSFKSATMGGLPLHATREMHGVLAWPSRDRSGRGATRSQPALPPALESGCDYRRRAVIPSTPLTARGRLPRHRRVPASHRPPWCRLEGKGEGACLQEDLEAAGWKLCSGWALMCKAAEAGLGSQLMNGTLPRLLASWLQKTRRSTELHGV